MFISAAYAATKGGNLTPAEEIAKAEQFPPFDPTHFPSQIFWLIVTFGLLYWLMSKVALPRVTEILDQRKARIENDLAQASQTQADADAAAAAYEKTLSDARAGAQASAKDMREKIAAEAEAQRVKLEGELNAKLADAETRIAQTKAAAMGNVSSIAEEVTGNIVQQLTGKAPDANAVKSAIASLKTN
ncbi:MAG: F0F1 ATP synthase subunit B [Hyphomicrobiales bacterium]|nr:F0F1 ATP synthase subunit B [Hyphomicrobiales bacterium]